MQAAFEIAEKNGDRLDPLFIGKVFEPFFPDLVGGDAILALLLGLQIQLFKLIVRESKKITQSVIVHESP